MDGNNMNGFDQNNGFGSNETTTTNDGYGATTDYGATTQQQYNYDYTYDQGNTYTGATKSGGNGQAIAAMVCGIVGCSLAVINCCCCGCPIINIILGIVAIVLGVISLKSEGGAKSVSGIILGAITILLALIQLGFGVVNAVSGQTASTTQQWEQLIDEFMDEMDMDY